MHTAYSLLGNWWCAGSGSPQARQAVWSEGRRKGQCGSTDGRVSKWKAPARQVKLELSGPPETDFRAKLENNLQTNCCSAQAANPRPFPPPIPSIPAGGLPPIQLELQPASQTLGCV